MVRSTENDGALNYEDDADNNVALHVEFEPNNTYQSSNTNDGATAFLNSCGLEIDFGDFGSDDGSEKTPQKNGGKTNEATEPQQPKDTKDKAEDLDDPTLKKAPRALDAQKNVQVEDKTIDLKNDENWTKRKDTFNTEITRLENFITTISGERTEVTQNTKKSVDALLTWNRKNAELNQLKQDKKSESDDTESNSDAVGTKLVEDLNDCTKQLAQLDQRERALEITVACLRIASGDDEQIRKGEKSLLTLVKLHPSLQQDGQFHDLVLKGYIEMAGARAARGLSPWKVELKLDDTAGDSKAKPSGKSSLELLKSANEKFWNEDIDAAVKDFGSALDSAKLEKQEIDRKRLSAFIAGLSKDAEIAETVIKNQPDEELLKAKVAQVAEEKKLAGDSLEKSNFTDSVVLNTALAKIACGDKTRFGEGISELKAQLSRVPEDGLGKEFLESLNKSMDANLKNALPLKNKDKSKESEDKTKVEYKDLDFAKIKNPSQDAPVASYLADDATTAALTVLGLALAIATTRRTISRLRDQRVLNDLYEAKPLDGLPKNSPFNLKNGDGTETKLEYKGRFDTSERVILRDASAKDDWKKNQSAGVSAGSDFDLKAKKYGEYERLRVDGRDFFVDKQNNVHIERKGQMYPTSEIRVLTAAQFEKLRNTDIKPLSGENKISEPIDLVPATDSSESKPKHVDPEKFPETLKEVCELARNTDSFKTAEKCVDWLKKARPEGFVEGLFELAKGDSRAAIPALIALADRPDSAEEACKLVMDRWNSGDFLTLQKENKVNLLRMEELFLHDKIKSPEIWKESWIGLADSQEARGRLARYFLSSADWGGDSNVWICDIPDELRKNAFDFVVENHLPGFDSTLAEVAQMRHPGISDRAAEALQRKWTSETQPEKGIAISKLLEGELIKKFSDEAKQFKWSDTTFDPEKTQKSLAKVRRQIETTREALASAASEEVVKFVEDNYKDPQAVKEKLEKETYFEEAKKLIELTEQKNALKDELKVITESRQADLQRLADSFCKANGLPKTNLKVEVYSRTALGTYSSSDNRLTVKPDLVLINGGIQPSLSSTLLHELGHHEQTSLIACNLADELGIEKEATPAQVDSLLKLYHEKTGRELDRTRAEQTLEIRAGKKLSEPETARSAKLILAKKDHADQLDNEKKVKELSKKLEEARSGLESDIPLEDVLKLPNEESAKALLGVEHLPEELSKALAELEKARSTDGAFAEVVASIDVRHELTKAISERLFELRVKSHRTYIDRFHEQETHAIGARADFFSHIADLETPPTADESRPEGKKESRSTKVLDLTEEAAKTRFEDAERVVELRQSEVVRKILIEAGMPESKAKEMERKLTSSDEKERESAVREINKHFDEKAAASETTSESSKTGKEGKDLEEKQLRGWTKFQSKLRDHKGKLATVVILTAPIVASMMKQENSKDSSKGSTFSK